ncbi:MAG: CDP-diacylglycerol--glycerol-3-phosphate 3-phosphatidyltransferase [Bacteriovoracia bacterium]
MRKNEDKVRARILKRELALNTVANKLTALRIAFVPLVVLALAYDLPGTPLDRHVEVTINAGFWAAIFFGIAGITDWLDGYYARTYQAITVIGKLLDPLADKFLVVSSLIMLMKLNRIHAYVVILLVCREIGITGLRAIASAEGIVIAAGKLGKWKTITQMAAIPFLMLVYTFPFAYFDYIGSVLIYASLLISLWSAKDYIVEFFYTLRENALKKRRERIESKLAKRRERKKQRSRSS